MKKILLLIIEGVLSITCFAQYATLEHTFPGEYVNISNYKDHPDEVVLLAYNTAANTVRIYDTDYSLLVSFSPKLPEGYQIQSAYYPSRNVYSKDNNFYVLIMSINPTAISTGNTRSYLHCGLYNSNGDEVFDFGTDHQISFSNFLVVNDEYRIIMYTGYLNNGIMEYTSRCYKLGGSTTALSSPKQEKQNLPFPNPSNTTINIPYSVSTPSSMLIYDVAGNLVDRKFINPTQNQFVLNVSSYSEGMYFYVINGESKPFIVE